jgi:peroxiredoxin
LLAAGLLLCLCFAAGRRICFAAEPLVDQQAPEFARAALMGGHVDLASFRGKVVLLNYWASWCAPCLVEMPVFVKWQREFGPRRLQVVGVSMDDDPALARRIAIQLKLNYPVAIGDEKLGELYGGVLGLPLSFLIDKKGRVRARFQGETDPKTIEKKWKELLAER